jgi:hypothetical protein
MVASLSIVGQAEFRDCVHVLKLKVKPGKVGTPQRADAIARLEAERDRLRALLQREEGKASAEDSGATSELTEEDDEENRGELSDDERVEGERHSPPSQPSSASTPLRPARTSSRLSPSARRRESEMSDDEIDYVQQLVNQGSARPRELQNLSEAGHNLYRTMLDSRRAAQVGSRTASIRPSLPVVQSAAATARRSVTPPSHAVTFQQATTHEATREAVRDLLDASSSNWPASGLVRSPHRSNTDTATTPDRRAFLLQRLGVPESLATADILQHVRNLVRDSSGSRSMEAWWSSQPHGKTQTHLYNEGLVLSLLLDHSDDPQLWQELAARRWLTIQLVMSGSVSWEEAGAFLPLTSRGGLPASFLLSAQQFAKSQQAFRSSSTRTPSSWASARSGRTEDRRQGRDSQRHQPSTTGSRERSRSRGDQRGGNRRRRGSETESSRETTGRPGDRSGAVSVRQRAPGESDAAEP